MLNNNPNDVQYIPQNNNGQLQRPQYDVVTQQPPPSYVQSQPPMVRNQPAPVYIINGQAIPVVCAVPVNTGIPTSYQAVNIHAYTRWSIFNILCCGLFCGILAFCMSRETQKRKMVGDHKGARSASRCTAAVNTIATLSGIAFYVVLGLYQVGVLID